MHHRRLNADERARVLRATGASHILGDDVLCPSSGRGGAGLADFWKIAPAYASLPIPLVVFPDYLVPYVQYVTEFVVIYKVLS